MYFPYLRGRQFELIALRELLEKGLIHEDIIPIIEPVKLSSTLIKTLSSYVAKDREIGLIHNPKVGSFNKDISILKGNPNKDKYQSLFTNKNIIKTHLINKDSEYELSQLCDLGISKSEMMTININQDFLSVYSDEFNNEVARFNLIPDERTFRRGIRTNKVILDNKFKKLPRNVDYRDRDEFFSDDHLYYKEDGYIGFSDYSIVGDDYSESGFAPYAVAIHITYFDKDKNLRIIHFVSDSNDDIKDPGGKFYEAVSKLYEWQKENDIETFGIKEFIKHYEEGTYPGLGTVKKLSIMHHIELMSQFLRGV